MHFLILLFLPLTFLSAKAFTIASYNVENLFDMQRNGYEYPQYLPYQHNWNPRTLQQKLTNISEVICDLNADIIALQEIENRSILERLQKSLRQYGCHYPYAASSQTPRSAIQVAVLSKIPMQRSKDIVVKRVGGIRHILEVTYRIEGYPLYLYINHWNSKRAPESKRIASALALKKRLDSLPKGSEYILLGDFNSHYNEHQTIEPKNNDTQGRTGINQVLETITSQHQMVRECNIDSQLSQHYNLWLELPIYRRWSHNFYGKKQGLDAILIPTSLMDGRGIDYVNNSFDVLKKKYLFHPKGYIRRWEYRNHRHTRRGYSDHLPIMAHFSTQPYQSQSCKINAGRIATLHRKSVTLPVRLEQVTVTQKNKNQVTIRDRHGDQIRIFGIDTPFVLGKSYDIIAHQRKLYKGAYEITDYTMENN
ncbi:MAG TPA: hypothetical protein ENK86_07255 [Campylobacterales bacterium]|nr:hypothetical protein [Campylobacterales bacterium]